MTSKDERVIDLDRIMLENGGIPIDNWEWHECRNCMRKAIHQALLEASDKISKWPKNFKELMALKQSILDIEKRVK